MIRESTYRLFKRYLWLVNTIKDAGHISMQDINNKWRNASLNDNKEEYIPKKTFYRHKESVEKLFGISIKHQSSDNTYYIEEELETDDLKEWLLNSFSVYNLLQEGYDMKDVILFERIPSGTEYLLTILNAIKSKHTLKIEYKKFKDEDSKTFEAEPYCLKVDKRRWYVLAKRTDEKEKKTYALDRIQNIAETENSYDYPEKFSPKKYFENSFGIINDEKKNVEEVIIKANKDQANYLRTLPLHQSQKETLLDDGVLFHYKIKIDKEFEMELLKLGSNIEIIQPKSLRDCIIKETQKILKLYK
ncbi:MAG: WYL domain-containing protein [Paludibacteraceae bacterium]|nr:WYL domain-containing protein [Paludibacteraceae bacterium]